MNTRDPKVLIEKPKSLPLSEWRKWRTLSISCVRATKSAHLSAPPRARPNPRSPRSGTTTTTMPPTTGYSFGDIVVVPFPFTDQSATKPMLGS